MLAWSVQRSLGPYTMRCVYTRYGLVPTHFLLLRPLIVYVSSAYDAIVDAVLAVPCGALARLQVCDPSETVPSSLLATGRYVRAPSVVRRPALFRFRFLATPRQSVVH
jgi:hypothetical protein